MEQTEQSAVSSVAQTPGQTREKTDHCLWQTDTTGEETEGLVGDGAGREGRIAGDGAGREGRVLKGRGARGPFASEVNTTVSRHEILLQCRIKTVL